MKYSNRKKTCLFLTLVVMIASIPLSVINASADFNIGEIISSSKLNTDNDFEPEAGMLLLDITNAKVIENSAAVSGFHSSDIKRLILLLVMLESYSYLLDEYIVISDDTTALIDAIPELTPGDSIKLSELLKHYMYSSSSHIFDFILEYYGIGYDGLAIEVESLVENSMLTQTKLSEDSINKGKSQKTSAFDLYIFIDKLLNHSWFINNIGKKSITISWVDEDDISKSIKVNDSMYKKAADAIPEGYSFIGHLTLVDSSGSSQIIIALDNKNTAYLSIVLGKSIGSNLHYISKKVFNILSGVPYLTMKEEELINQTPEPTNEPDITPVPTKEPAPSVTDQPKPTSTPTPTKGAYSTPTSSYSSISIPKDNKNLEKYGLATLPIGSENERYQYLLGTNETYYTFDRPPEGYKYEAMAAKNMVTITVPVWKMAESGVKFSSQYDVTINKRLAANVKKIFDEIYKLPIQFPIKLLKGYSYREVGGVGLSNITLMSMHAFGAAIDINPDNYENDYFLGAGNDLRDKSNPFCIPDEVIEVFRNNGWNWGGDFSICSDTMHFQYLGLDFLSYQDKDPFRVLKSKNGEYRGLDVWNLQVRLRELGYRINVDGVFGKETESVVMKFQKKQDLPVTGIVDYKTWETVINLTHYLSYVF